MDHSLNRIAQQVLNGVYAGLKQPNNFSISIEQIKDEIAQMRNRMLYDGLMSGKVDLEPYRQSVFKLPVAKKDFSGADGYSTNHKEYYAQVPELFHVAGSKPVAWVTAMDRKYPFKVVYGNDFMYVKYDKYSKLDPTIWISDTNLWLLNPPIANVQHISLRAVFENPRAVNGLAGMKFIDDDSYPAPIAILSEIRNKLVNDYIRQYRMGNLQPTFVAADIGLSSPSGK